MKNYNEAETILEMVSAAQAAPEAQEVVEEIVEPVEAVEEKPVEKKLSTKDQLAEAKAEIERLTAQLGEITELNASLQKTIDTINEKPADIETPSWTHVSEMLPEEGSLSIVFGEGTNGVTTAYYRSNMNMWKNGTIKFWMPMPEAPVEVSVEG